MLRMMGCFLNTSSGLRLLWAVLSRVGILSRLCRFYQMKRLKHQRQLIVRRTPTLRRCSMRVWLGLSLAKNVTRPPKLSKQLLRNGIAFAASSIKMALASGTSHRSPSDGRSLTRPIAMGCLCTSHGSLICV